MAALLSAALDYAAEGWPVFPCGPDKRPLIRNGFKAATKDPAAIRKWWVKRPEANIGVPTGPEGIGLWVLDVDNPETHGAGSDGFASLAALEKEHGPLPATLEQRTGGGGRQLFFRWPKGRTVKNSAKKLGPGLDTRGVGGYVVVSPSGHSSGGRYAWTSAKGLGPVEAPAWLLDLATAAKKKPGAQKTPNAKGFASLLGKTVGRDSKEGLAALEDALSRVGFAAEGERNSALNEAAFQLGGFVGGGRLSEVTAATKLLEAATFNGLPEAEARATIASGLAAGVAKSLASPFRTAHDGLYYLAVDKKLGVYEVKVCSPLEVRAFTRDSENGEWGRLLVFPDPGGNEHVWPMPMSLLAGGGEELRAHLLSAGLLIEPGRTAQNALCRYLTQSNPDRWVRCVPRIGWHGSRFVLPDATFGGGDAEEVVLQSANPDNPFRVRGTLAEWQERVGRLCLGNSRLLFAVSAALAAPMLHLAEAESGGFHFVGASSTGKTTTLGVAGSVCGGGGLNGYPRSWRTTDNGLESVAASHCDTLLCLDELSQVDARAAAETAYMLGNGQGKTRSKRDGAARKPQEWRVLFLSTGEITLADKIREDGRARASAGQAVRVVDIPADAGGGLGLFENLHGLPDASAFARRLKEGAERHYGTALRAFLEHLTERPSDHGQEAKSAAKAFLAAHCPAKADGQVERVCLRFGLVAAAGELGARFGVLPWPQGSAEAAAARCFKDWLATRGHSGAAEMEDGMAQVRAFFLAHGASRFEELGRAGEKVINSVGWKRPTLDGDPGDTCGWEYLVPPEAFRNEIARGHESHALARALVARGYLAPAPDGKLSQSVHVAGVGQSRVYVFKPSVLGKI